MGVVQRLLVLLLNATVGAVVQVAGVALSKSLLEHSLTVDQSPVRLSAFFQGFLLRLLLPFARVAGGKRQKKVQKIQMRVRKTEVNVSKELNWKFLAFPIFVISFSEKRCYDMLFRQ